MGEFCAFGKKTLLPDMGMLMAEARKVGGAQLSESSTTSNHSIAGIEASFRTLSERAHEPVELEVHAEKNRGCEGERRRNEREHAQE